MKRSYVFVRPATPADAATVIEWSKNTPECDYKAGLYRTSFTLCAFDKDGPLAYLPVQMPLVFEALATRPGATPQEVALALKELVQECVTQAYIRGAGELYFLCTEESAKEFATNQVFEELPWRVCRMKLSDLEKPKS
jgi:hypothetical protein